MLDYMTEGPLSTLDSLPPDTFNALVALFGTFWPLANSLVS